LAVLFKPFRLLQGYGLHAQLNAFVTNDSGGLLALHIHRSPSDYGKDFLLSFSTERADDFPPRHCFSPYRGKISMSPGLAQHSPL
jgi:hypothetical protein